MDARFKEAWENLCDPATGRARADRMRKASDRELIAALAAAGDHPELPARVMANAIATELLNRHRRRPFLITFLMSAFFVLAAFILDAIIFESPLGVIRGRTGGALAILAAASAVVSILAWLLWKGAFPRLQHHFRRGKY